MIEIINYGSDHALMHDPIVESETCVRLVLVCVWLIEKMQFFVYQRHTAKTLPAASTVIQKEGIAAVVAILRILQIIAVVAINALIASL